MKHDRPSHVYFLSNGGLIKIGVTVNLEYRMKQLSEGVVGELVLIAKIDGDVHVEKALHRLAAPYRVRGEWFADCAELRALIEDVLARGPTAYEHMYVAPPAAPRGERLTVYQAKKKARKAAEDGVSVACWMRLHQLMDHPIMVQMRGAAATAKDLGIDPAPALVPILKRIPRRGDGWKAAREALDTAYERLRRLDEMEAAAIVLEAGDLPTLPDKLEGMQHAAISVVDEAERIVFAELGALTKAQRRWRERTTEVDVLLRTMEAA